MSATETPGASTPLRRVALVAGATGAVGQAIARALAAHGHPVVVHCRTDAATADVVVKELQRQVPATAVLGDLRSATQAEAVVAEAARRLGAPPTIVVNAAYPRANSRRVADLDKQEIDRHLDGFHMYANLCRATIPGMRAAGFGRVVLIAGALAARLWAGLSMMSSVKAGLTTFTRTLSLEEGVHGITANVVSPGRLEFEYGGGAFDPDPAYETLDEVTRLRLAQPSVPTPDDVGRIVAFLASDDAASVTGQTLYVAGGEPI